MNSGQREQRLSELLSDHRAALQEFAAKANAAAESGWLVPRAEGKWTPAQETRHLILAYDAFTGDLRGEKKMGLRGTPLRRLLWRLFGLTSILWRKRIPVAVRAPREARPEWDETPRPALLQELERRASEFETVFAQIWRAEPKRHVTHPFFGDLSLDQAIRMSAVHTRHHAAFLPSPLSR